MFKNKLLFFFLFIFLWTISGWTYCEVDGYDIDYSEEYTDFYLMQLANPGFYGMVRLFWGLGISYPTFKILFFGIVMFLFMIIIFKYSKKPLPIVFIYLFTAFFSDTIQLKNTIATCFLYIGLIVLLNNDYRYRKILFASLIFVASSFHISFIFYLVFLLEDFKIKPMLLILLSIILSILGQTFFGYISNNAFVNGSEFLQSRQNTYMASSSFWSITLCTVAFVFHYFVCEKYIFPMNDNKSVNHKRLLKINLLLAILIVFSGLATNMFRLFRNMLLLDSIFIINGYLAISKKERNPLLLYSYFVSMSLWNFWLADVSNFSLDIILMNSLWN